MTPFSKNGDSSPPAVALVFGGSGGIGASVVQKLRQQNITVYFTYLHHESVAQELAARTQSHAIRCDLGQSEAVLQAVQTLIGREGRLNLVVNCSVGKLQLKRCEDLTDEEMRQDLDVILMGSFRIAKATLPELRKSPDAALVYILSSAAQAAPARMSSYVAAKAGLGGWMRSLAAELANSSVRVLGVSPSFVETSLLNAFPNKLLEIERSRQSSGTLLQPSEIAEVIWQMKSDPPRFPNGTIFDFQDRKS